MLPRRCIGVVDKMRSLHQCNCNRTFAMAATKYAQAERKEVTESTGTGSSGQLQTSFAQKTKENVKTASYGGVIVVGLGVTGYIGYVVFKELFGSNSPSALFDKAAAECMDHPKVQDLLGPPIKSFGEETRRGRRTRVASMEYKAENGRKGVRLQFYLQGRRNRATCQLDAREDAAGCLQTRFLIVSVEDMLRNNVIVHDNR